MDTLDRRIDRIRTALARLAAADVHRTVFGASTHGYALAPPWPEARVDAFERLHRVRLPEEYRRFVTTLGSAGAGPYYGLQAPAALELDAFPRVTSRITTRSGEVYESGTPKRPGFGATSSLSRPFPLDRPFEPSLVYDLPAVPPGAAPYDGCLRLADIGCGYFDLLAVHGHGAGQVWNDTMAALHGARIVPTHEGFLAWYEAWLRTSLTELGLPGLPPLSASA
jgi:hypothetical protein